MPNMVRPVMALWPKQGRHGSWVWFQEATLEWMREMAPSKRLLPIKKASWRGVNMGGKSMQGEEGWRAETCHRLYTPPQYGGEARSPFAPFKPTF